MYIFDHVAKCSRHFGFRRHLYFEKIGRLPDFFPGVLLKMSADILKNGSTCSLDYLTERSLNVAFFTLAKRRWKSIKKPALVIICGYLHYKCY